MLPCYYCYEFHLERELWKHVKTCKSRPEDEDHKEKYVKARARMFLEGAKANLEPKRQLTSNPFYSRISEKTRKNLNFLRSMLPTKCALIAFLSIYKNDHLLTMVRE